MKIISVCLEDERPDTGLRCKDKSLTQQNLAAECDINSIVKKFEQTGLISHVSDRVAQYGDFSEVADFQSALATVRVAESAFMSLPAFVRERFDNDPAALIAFVQDPQNREEALKLGILEPKKGVEAPKPVEAPKEPQKA